MFYPVRVFSPEKLLIKTIGTANLSKRHWDMFEDEEKGRFLTNENKKKVLRVRKQLDIEFSDFGVTPSFQ